MPEKGPITSPTPWQKTNRQHSSEPPPAQKHDQQHSHHMAGRKKPPATFGTPSGKKHQQQLCGENKTKYNFVTSPQTSFPLSPPEKSCKVKVANKLNKQQKSSFSKKKKSSKKKYPKNEATLNNFATPKKEATLGQNTLSKFRRAHSSCLLSMRLIDEQSLCCFLRFA